ncbi:uncharacterized protein LOC128680582 isoform X2 [Plodia interpunctella]|nr:uncharacterized protein LOC128680582 isoform X2 [Plodia interpunctella]
MASPSQDMELIYDSVHSLLEPPSPAYTNVTVRRAFIVWMYCGQKNNFQRVCDYYHYLEAMEDTLSPEERALSRHHEFNMFSNHPPTSRFLNDYFPKLYSHRVEPSHIEKLEAIKNEQCVFKLEGFSEIPQQKVATQEEILQTSKIVRRYCKTKMIPLKKFFDEFKQFATRCELSHTVNNVAYYIQRKGIRAELYIVNNMPKTFSFLDTSTIIEDVVTPIVPKPKVSKVGHVIGAKDVKLNPTCAAFFNSFNKKYLENKSVPASPLIDPDSFYNVSRDKMKSRSVESLLSKNFNVKSEDSSNSFLNFDEFTKIRRI